MENASKALIMAGTVLMGILLISLGVYMFAYFGSVVSSISEEIEITKLIQFNAQFAIYDNRDLTVQDVVTIASLAKENNDAYDMLPGYSSSFEDTLYVEVKLVKGYRQYTMHENSMSSNEQYLIADNEGRYSFDDIPYYKITSFSYNDLGRIYSITITSI